MIDQADNAIDASDAAAAALRDLAIGLNATKRRLVLRVIGGVEAFCRAVREQRAELAAAAPLEPDVRAWLRGSAASLSTAIDNLRMAEQSLLGASRGRLRARIARLIEKINRLILSWSLVLDAEIRERIAIDACRAAGNN